MPENNSPFPLYGVLQLPMTKNGPNGPDLTGRPLAPNFPLNRSRITHTRIATHRNHEDPGCSGFSEKAFDRLCEETLGDQRCQRCLLHFWKVSLKSSLQTDLQKNSLRSSFLFLVGQDGRPQVWHGAGPAPLYHAGVSSLKSCFFAIICWCDRIWTIAKGKTWSEI